MSALLELCVDEPASVVAAIAGGADRIELCAALALGGLTPSVAFAQRSLAACRAAGVALHAMVRPRGGDFAYDAAELALAIDEARALAAAGVDGLVFGAARNKRLDVAVLEAWVAAVRAAGAAPALTLHRAVDAVDDPVAAVAMAVELGFDCILTAGGAPSASAGIATIARMVAAASGSGVTIMAGSGVRAAEVPALYTAGVRAFHASAATSVAPADQRIDALGFATPPRRVADVAIVRALRDAIDRADTGQTGEVA